MPKHDTQLNKQAYSLIAIFLSFQPLFALKFFNITQINFLITVFILL